MEIMESSTWNEEELLLDELEKVSSEYRQNSCDEKRQSLLHFLQNNDCRPKISKCSNNDNLSKAFICAGQLNHHDILQTLLDFGMNIDIKDNFGNTALIYASQYGHEESVRLLLYRNVNVNVNIQNKSGYSALMYASGNRYKNVVQLLLDHNADIDLKCENNKTASDWTNDEEIKEMIQNHVTTSYVLK